MRNELDVVALGVDTRVGRGETDEDRGVLRGVDDEVEVTLEGEGLDAAVAVEGEGKGFADDEVNAVRRKEKKGQLCALSGRKRGGMEG